MKFMKRAYEMTTRVRFCLSYDRFKLDFIVFKGQDQDQDSYWWNAETTITHQEVNICNWSDNYILLKL